jgi:UDP-glucose 4-epimerase
VLADPAKSNNELGWKAELGLEDMVSSAWKWQKLNPKGYLS